VLFAQNGTYTTSSGHISPVVIVVIVLVVILEIAGMWRVFEKAGQPGWAAIIPIYNYYVLLKIVGKPGWWLVLFLIPLVNIVIAIIVLWELARSFGKGVGWFWGLLLLGPIFYPILGFGSSQYIGPQPPQRSALS
jgi:hypothetical protein